MSIYKIKYIMSFLGNPIQSPCCDYVKRHITVSNRSSIKSFNVVKANTLTVSGTLYINDVISSGDLTFTINGDSFNIILDDTGHIKIIDFGFRAHICFRCI